MSLFSEFEQQRVAQQEEVANSIIGKDKDSQAAETAESEPSAKSKKKKASPSKNKKVQENPDKNISVCVTVPEDLYIKIKIYAIENRTTVSRLVRDWIRSL